MERGDETSRYCQDCLGDCCCPSLEAEVERLKAQLDAIAEDGTDEHNAAVGMRTALAQARADLARVTAERDAMAKRWEALRDWLPVDEYSRVYVGSLCMKMRELEGQR
jgi:hypothetical protein